MLKNTNRSFTYLAAVLAFRLKAMSDISVISGPQSLDVVVKTTAIHQMNNAINIEIAISDILPKPLREFLIGQLELGKYQIASTTEILLLV